MVITIDGPSASGKSTVARLLAAKLNLLYIASGLLYRGLAFALMQAKGYTNQTIANATEQDIHYCIDAQRFAYGYSTRESIAFENADITPFLKTPKVDTAASFLGTNAQARQAILQYIRTLALHHDIIIDGRDCGSVMFPNAEYKWYMTASPEIRAYRWQQMQAQLGIQISFDQALESIMQRDIRDTQRILAPLQVPHGARVIDVSDMSVQEIVAAMCEQIV